MKQKVLISGGSGLVGTRLTEILLDKGYDVGHLSRQVTSNTTVETIVWDVNNMKLDFKAIEKYDYIIQLAGAGIIDKPWTKDRKKAIIDSRVKSTQLLKLAIESNSTKPKAFISASAIGFYGLETSEHTFLETDLPGKDFLAETCVLWEQSINELESLTIPLSRIRIGLVLSKHGGALKEMAKPIKFGFGAALGSGKQYMPWIHIDDLCNLFIFCFENGKSEIYNGVAPNQMNNNEFYKNHCKSFRQTTFITKYSKLYTKNTTWNSISINSRRK